MSRRGGRNNRGRFGQGGGRGRGRNNNNSNGKNNNSNKTAGRKTLADHVYLIGLAKQASEYSVITQFITNHIRKSYDYGDDIGDALKSRGDITIQAPRLRAVAAGSANEELEARENEFLYKAQITAYVAREEKYQANKGKAFALIFGQCNKALQHKLQSRTDFEPEIKGNPFELLNAISEHLMSYMENKYPFSIAIDAVKNYINLKQTVDESLVDYTQRFKAAKKIMETHIRSRLELPELAKLDPR